MIKTVIKRAMQTLRINNIIVKSAKGKDTISAENCPIDIALSVLEKAHHNAKSSCICNSAVDKDLYDLQIIVPAYNVEKYIQRCLDSILNTDAMETCGFSYTVTVVNDGSTDGTENILQRYRGDDRVKIISQSNQGLSSARNTGLRITDRGKYILFVDSDDEVDMTVCARLLNKAIADDLDIVQGEYKIITENGKRKKHSSGENLELNGFAWGKIYKNRVFEHIKFPEKYIFEDSIVKQIIDRMGYSVYCSSDCLYFYRSNPKGITQSNCKNNRAIDSLYITLQLHDDGQKMELPVNDAYYNYILDMIKLTYIRTKYLDEVVQKAIFIVFKNFICDNFGNCKANSDYRLQIKNAVQSGDFGLYKAICEWY